MSDIESRANGESTQPRPVEVYRAAMAVLAVQPNTPVSFRMAMESMAESVTTAVLSALRALPAEQRMEAMGMMNARGPSGTIYCSKDEPVWVVGDV